MFASEEEIAQRVSDEANLVNRPVGNTPRRLIIDPVERKEVRYENPEVCDSDDSDTTVIAPLHNGGRREGDKNIPASLRSIIGAVARFDTLEHTAEAFGVSTHHVHELKHGKHSNAQGQDDKLVDAINEKLEQPHDIAVKKLTEALLKVNVGHLDESKPKDVVFVAKQLASIADSTAPIKKDDGLGDGGTKLIVYAPTIRQENKYESVSVQRSS